MFDDFCDNNDTSATNVLYLRQNFQMFYAKCACVLACCDCFFLCRAFNDIQFLMVCFDLGPNKPFFLRLTTSYMVINWSQSSGAFHLAKIFGSTIEMQMKRANPLEIFRNKRTTIGGTPQGRPFNKTKKWS